MTFEPGRDPQPFVHGAVRRRDRYRYAVTALTGLAAAGSLTATGWLAGQAAHAWSVQQDVTPGTATVDPAGAVPQPADRSRARDRRPGVVLRNRPTRTRVSTNYVTPSVPVGGGGSVGSAPSHSSSHTSPPAPSSGS
jgi:hypothetical protein